MSNATEQKLATDLSATLQKIGLAAGARIEEDFKSTLNANFDKMSDANVSLYLFLTAIDCYLKNGKVGEQVALQMAMTVRAKWSSSKGLSGVERTLTPTERALIARSSLANRILGAYATLGIQ